MKVTLQLFQTVGEDFTFLTCHLYRAGIRTWLHLQQERKEAGQYFLVNGSCLGTSAKEQNLHNFQHPTNLADNGFLSKEVLGLCLLEKYCCRWHNVQQCTEPTVPWELLPTEHWRKSSCLYPIWHCQLLFQPWPNSPHLVRECERCEGCPSFQAFPYMLGQIVSTLI